MRTNEPRITLERLKEGLREDPDFPREAVEALAQVDPQSTHTIATSAESLVEWWLAERELKCYERGEVVKDTTDVLLYPDDKGNYEAAKRSIELAWQVDRGVLQALASQARIIEADEIEKRLAALEQAAAKKG